MALLLCYTYYICVTDGTPYRVRGPIQALPGQARAGATSPTLSVSSAVPRRMVGPTDYVRTCPLNTRAIGFTLGSLLSQSGRCVSCTGLAALTDQYLHNRSCHSNHCNRNIPCSQALRLRQICSIPEDYHQRTVELKGYLVDRGYNEDSVKQQIDRLLGLVEMNC